MMAAGNPGVITLAEAKRALRRSKSGGGGAGPQDDHLPPGFEMRADGLWRTLGDERAFWVCDYFEVVAETRPPASDDWGLLLEWRDKEGTPFRYIMPHRLLANDAAEVFGRMLACGLRMDRHSPPARLALLQFLQKVRCAALVRTVPRTGWYRPATGGAAFVLPGRSIGETGGEVVVLGLDPAPPIYRARGSLDGWRREVAARCIGNSRLLFAVSCAFAAPLLELVGAEGGGVNLCGKSSSGKTTIIDVAASVWGAPSKTDEHSFVRQWRSTSGALEVTAAAHSHALLPMDEMGQADPKEIGETLYMLANGVGRSRMRSDGGNRTLTTWLLLVLSTSESSAASLATEAGKRIKAGQEVRLLDVPAVVSGSSNSCFEKLHGELGGADFAQALRDAALAQHGTAAPAFLEWLTARLRQDSMFPAAVLAARERAWLAEHVPAGADGQVHRAARRLALVAVAGELGTEAGITGWPPGEAAAAAATIFRDWLAERGGIGSREDHHLFAALRHFVGMHGGSRFDLVREPTHEADGAQVAPPLPEGPRTVKRAGWRWQEANEAGEQQWVHGLLPQVFAAEIAGPLGLEERDARARLGKAGLIRGRREGSEMRWSIAAKRIPGAGRVRLLVIESHALEG